MNSKPDRIILVGGGVACTALLSIKFLDDRLNHDQYMAIVDDRNDLRGATILGVTVAGSLADLPRLIDELQASAVIIAISTPNNQLVEHVERLVKGRHVALFRVPTYEELVYGARITQLRRVGIGLKSRDFQDSPSEDLAPTPSRINGSFIVTGAGGSIGSEVVRQLAMNGASKIVCFDRDESSLLNVTVRAEAVSPGVTDGYLGDLRDESALQALFAANPEACVIHTAALKHLSMLERFPREAWKTNVLGTLNVLETALSARVGSFINVSTDKAAAPTSTLGLSKLITEKLLSSMVDRHPDICLNWHSVRFGNVTRSRGSVFEVFETQAARGGPITVSDPAVKRFFISIEDAARFIIESPSFANPGETVIPEMGLEVGIQEIAERIASRYSPNLEIVYTGLRPGEKLRETLTSENDGPVRNCGQSGAIAVRPSPLSPADVRSKTVDDRNARHIMELLIGRA